VIVIEKPKTNENTTDNTTNIQNITNRDISGSSQDLHNHNTNTTTNNSMNNRMSSYLSKRDNSPPTKCSSRTLRFFSLKSLSTSSDYKENEPSVLSLICDANTRTLNNNTNAQSSKSLHSYKGRFKFNQFQQLLEQKKCSSCNNEPVANELLSTSDDNEHPSLDSRILSLLSKFLRGPFISFI
jgi:hypothetical protein